MGGTKKHIYHTVLREPGSSAGQSYNVRISFFGKKLKYLPIKDFNKINPGLIIIYTAVRVCLFLLLI